MAKPIKETPILKGKDARRFINEMESKKYRKEMNMKRMLENYHRIKALEK